MLPFSAVKVFSSSMAREREVLGDRVGEWLKRHPELTIVDTVVTQTSDREYHCLTITLFLEGDPTAYLAEQPSRPMPPARSVVPRPR
jgi:hypothetical protein